MTSQLDAERRWLFVMAACTAVEFGWWAVCWIRGDAPTPMVGSYLLLTGAAFGTTFLLRRVVGSGRPQATPTSVAAALILIVLASSLFLPLKFAIPKEISFWLDWPLARFEEEILGAQPWFVLDGLFGRATPLVDRIYGLWLPVQLIVLFAVVLEPASRAKTRALTAYSLTWFVLGVLAATILSSAGPIFYDRLYGGATFGALRPAMQARGAWMTLAESDAMWAAYAGNRPSLVSGISAIPSLHVAISVWIYLTARIMAPRAAPVALAYAIVIWVASIQLGWHYVSDGLIGAAGMLAIWIAAGGRTFRSTGVMEPAVNQSLAIGRYHAPVRD